MDDNADSQEREEGAAVTEAQLQAAPVVDVDVEAAFEQIRHALRGLRYGDVRVTVQDGVVVQIERTERRRPPRTKR